MRIQLEVDVKAALRASATILRQVEFATAQALNDVVKGAQQERRAALPLTFTIRSAQSQRFLDRFIKIPRDGFAKKGKLFADIMVSGPGELGKNRSKVLTRHEAGGTFRSGINPFFIPGNDMPGGAIPRYLYPAALGLSLRRGIASTGGRKTSGFEGGKRKGKRRTFILPLASGNELIARRVGHQGELDILWLLTRKPIRIQPRLGFVRGVSEYARHHFGPAFRARFTAAIRGELR